jgi:Domain of unknown function DUF29
MLSGDPDTVTAMPDGPRYDEDFYAWTQHQAMVLRSMTVADNRFDRDHVAEEIEDLGKSERDAVRTQVRRIIEHFLKLSFSPTQSPRFDWMASIAEARDALEDKISPTLRRDTEAMFEKLYEGGRNRAELGLRSHGEMEAASKLPTRCPYTLEEVIRHGWYPDPPGEKP